MLYVWMFLGIVVHYIAKVLCDAGGIPHWANGGGHVPPGHANDDFSHGNHHGHVPPGHVPPAHRHESQSGHEGQGSMPDIEMTSELYKYEQKYKLWWEVFQTDLAGCGKQHAPPLNPLFRVIGGKIATIAKWPWMVSLYSTLILQPWCAGTLVARQWVVTAAHCFNGPFANPAFYTLHFGKNNASGFAEFPDEQVRTIRNLTIHPTYNGVARQFAFDNDIAIIKLDKPVVFNDHTSPLCLVRDSDHVTDSVRTDTKCSITGYGISSATNVKHEINVLHEARVPLIEKTTCSGMAGYGDKFTDNMICAGFDTGAVDSCNGDSGGPLQCQIDNKWYLVGVTSWGGSNYEGCAEPNQPGVYTDVSKYTPWIYTHIFNDTTG